MTINNFYLNYGVTGNERKRLVKAIGDYMGVEPRYLGAPSFAYDVDYFYIDRNGCVGFDDRADSEEIEGLIEALAGQGFVCEEPASESVAGEAAETAQEPEAGESDNLPAGEPESTTAADRTAESGNTGFTVSMPREGITDEALGNLRKLIASKATLIQKALAADRLEVETTDDRVCFPWWDYRPEPEEANAYMSFVAALCSMAINAKRVTAKEKETESEKYTFRGFLLRMGLGGAESKTQRHILLKRLSGSSAFPNKEKADAFGAAQKAKREAAKATGELIAYVGSEAATATGAAE